MQPEAVRLLISDMDLTWPQARLVERLCAEEYCQFHTWLPHAARSMQRNDMTPEQIFPVLRERADFHSRHVSNGEIRDAINLVFGSEPEAGMGRGGEGTFRSLPWQLKLDLIARSADWEPDYTLSDLLGSNVVPVRELCQIDPRLLVRLLFKGTHDEDSLVCVAKRKPNDDGFVNRTVSLKELERGDVPSDFNLIVPNSPVQRHGFTKNGHQSQRALESFPDRRFIVLESDIGANTWDIQARLIRFAGKVWDRDPVMVVCSGSKSLHAWFATDGLPEKRIRNFMMEMKGLFDTATLQRNQLVRLPNRRRGSSETSSGNPQVVLFVNWQALM